MSEKVKKTRLYKVTVSGHLHLIEAVTTTSAVRHVVKGKIHAEIVSALDAVKLIGEGHKVEYASVEAKSDAEVGYVQGEQE